MSTIDVLRRGSDHPLLCGQSTYDSPKTDADARLNSFEIEIFQWSANILHRRSHLVTIFVFQDVMKCLDFDLQHSYMGLSLRVQKENSSSFLNNRQKFSHIKGGQISKSVAKSFFVRVLLQFL